MEFTILFFLGIMIISYIIVVFNKKRIEKEFYYNKLTGLPTKEYVTRYALNHFNKHPLPKLYRPAVPAVAKL